MEFMALQFLRASFVRALLLGQIDEQFPDACILRAFRCPLVKAPGLHFHGGSLSANLIQPEWPQKPDGLALDESSYVLAANQGDVLAELAAVHLDQTVAMTGFFLAHAVKQRRGGREILPQSLCVVGVDALVFFFEGDGQRKNLALTETFKGSQHSLSFPNLKLKEDSTVPRATSLPLVKSTGPRSPAFPREDPRDRQKS